MKSWVWLILLVVVILAVFAVMAAFKPKTAEAPMTTVEPVRAGEELSPGAQPIQLVPKESPELTASSAAESVTIEINDTGFTPATVRVKAGATVTFVNNGQALHWPASAPHPAHTDLPEFDAKKGLATGEEYMMVFNKIGTWRFHDHLNPTMTGSVVVE